MSTAPQIVDAALIAADTAQALLELHAVLVYEGRPFIYTTGWASPVYVDCHRVMSRPDLRRKLMDHAAALLRSRLSDRIDVVAGAETSGIPFAAWIAERLGLPMVYVRKKPIGWGVNAQVEGELHVGATVEHVFVLFNYDIYPQSRRAYAESGITLHALATWRDIFSATKALHYFEPHRAKEIKTFLGDPIAWSIEHGGAGSLPQGSST